MEQLTRMAAKLFAVLILISTLTLGACGAPENTDDVGAVSQALVGKAVNASPGCLGVFAFGDYNSFGFLRWSSTSPYRRGGSELPVPNKKSYVRIMTDNSLVTGTEVIMANGSYAGECVTLIKQCSNRYVDGTSTWSRGVNVMQNARNVGVGTAIARFSGGNGTFISGSDHVGFYAGNGPDASGYSGFYVYDQNYYLKAKNDGNSDAAVRYHFIRVKNDGTTSDANVYYTLLAP